MPPGRGEEEVGDAGSDRAAETVLEPEDLARANLYGLISRLFYGPADPGLLAEINSSAGGEGGQGSDRGLVAAWRGLREACRSAYPAVVRQEYDGLFVGVGKAQVTPYLSGYAEASAPDRYLVRLRGQLAAWGLARRDGVNEVEDHISGISDVMRWLIENQRPYAEQQQFFESFAYPGAIVFCAAVQKATSASFYKHVAAFTGFFLEVERAAFEMGDTA
jgi:TorA maturation chaperone TorD